MGGGRVSSFNHSLAFLGGPAGNSDRPLVQGPETRSAHPLAAGKPLALPMGWTERMSKRYPGKKFFYNKATRETTWQRPDIDGRFPEGTQLFSSKTRTLSPRTRPQDRLQQAQTPVKQNRGFHVARVPFSGSSSSFPHVGHLLVPETPVGVKIGRSVSKLESLGNVDPFAGTGGYFGTGSGRSVRLQDAEVAEAAAKMRASLRFEAAGVAGASTGSGAMPGAMDTWAGQLGGMPIRR